MQAVFESQEGERFVFVIDEEQVARRMEVRVVGAEGTLQRIESDEIKTDMRVVVRGGAYLEAGDKVRIINEAEESR
jgi:multidrug efflux pump subunit AcrA (membrane-fusion protein)